MEQNKSDFVLKATESITHPTPANTKTSRKTARACGYLSGSRSYGTGTMCSSVQKVRSG